MHVYDAKHSVKFRQYQLRAISPNLMLAKFTHYTVIHLLWNTLLERLKGVGGVNGDKAVCPRDVAQRSRKEKVG